MEQRAAALEKEDREKEEKEESERKRRKAEEARAEEAIRKSRILEETLPHGWVMQVSSTSKKTFYMNCATNESQWEFPRTPAPWVRAFSTTRKQWYYRNNVDGRVQYSFPGFVASNGNVPPSSVVTPTAPMSSSRAVPISSSKYHDDDQAQNPKTSNTDSTSVPPNSPAQMEQSRDKIPSPAASPPAEASENKKAVVHAEDDSDDEWPE